MGLILPSSLALWNPLELARQKRAEEMAWAQQDYVDRKTKAAESGDQPPSMLPMDASEEDLTTSMSWDFSPGWEERRLKFVRGLKARRARFMPAARRPIPGGGFENIYPYGATDLAWFSEGLCCVRCLNWKHDDAMEHIREHERLRDNLTGMASPPSGVPLKDLCAFCGNRLDLQNYDQEQAA